MTDPLQWFGGATNPGERYDGLNQDAYYVNLKYFGQKPILLAGVFDGHAHNGEFSSEACVDFLQRYHFPNPSHLPLTSSSSSSSSPSSSSSSSQSFLHHQTTHSSSSSNPNTNSSINNNNNSISIKSSIYATKYGDSRY